MQLPRDDNAGIGGNPTAGGVLHWAPLREPGLRARMALIAAWMQANEPSVLISDVSVEVALLARLMGVPVVVIALPGHRNDPAHQLGYDIADAILAPWPALTDAMCLGLQRHAQKVHHVGGISRFDGRARLDEHRRGDWRTVLALSGAGSSTGMSAMPPTIPGWRLTTAGPENWLDDPWPALCAADVVVTHCGLGTLSDVAAAGKPAVLLPQQRPHEEQEFTARALAQAGTAVVLDREPAPAAWLGILDRAHHSDGSRWSHWSSGHGAAHAAAVIEKVAGSG
jgi:hypothetical protein